MLHPKPSTDVSDTTKIMSAPTTPPAGWKPFQHLPPNSRNLNPNQVASAGRKAAQHTSDPHRVRLDAVLLTCAALAGQQQTEARGLVGNLIHTTGTPDELRTIYRQLLGWLQTTLPEVFPPALPLPDWPDDALQTLTGAFDNVDLIGARTTSQVQHDIISQVFQHVMPMASKQVASQAYYTPEPVVHLMNRMVTTLCDDQQLWQQTTMEPAVGSGVMLVLRWYQMAQAIRTQHAGDPTAIRQAVTEANSNLVGIDIDAEAAWTARANLSVRVGLPAHIHHGNALTSPAAHHLPLAQHPHAAQDTSDTQVLGCVRQATQLLQRARQLPT